MSAEIERRQTRLQSHENRKHPGNPAVTVAKRMDQHQFNVYYRQSVRQLLLSAKDDKA